MKVRSNANASKLADRIRLARKRAHLSQTSLARQTGVTASAVSQWEHPQGTVPDLDRLVGISTATGVSLDWLIGGSGKLPTRINPADSSAANDFPAVALDAFACNLLEEKLLECFRALQPSAREFLVAFLESATSRRSR